MSPKLTCDFYLKSKAYAFTKSIIICHLLFTTMKRICIHCFCIWLQCLRCYHDWKMIFFSHSHTLPHTHRNSLTHRHTFTHIYIHPRLCRYYLWYSMAISQRPDKGEGSGLSWWESTRFISFFWRSTEGVEEIRSRNDRWENRWQW